MQAYLATILHPQDEEFEVTRRRHFGSSSISTIQGMPFGGMVPPASPLSYSNQRPGTPYPHPPPTDQNSFPDRKEPLPLTLPSYINDQASRPNPSHAWEISSSADNRRSPPTKDSPIFELPRQPASMLRRTSSNPIENPPFVNRQQAENTPSEQQRRRSSEPQSLMQYPSPCKALVVSSPIGTKRLPCIPCARIFPPKITIPNRGILLNTLDRKYPHKAKTYIKTPGDLQYTDAHPPAVVRKCPDELLANAYWILDHHLGVGTQVVERLAIRGVDKPLGIAVLALARYFDIPHITAISECGGPRPDLDGLGANWAQLDRPQLGFQIMNSDRCDGTALSYGAVVDLNGTTAGDSFDMVKRGGRLCIAGGRRQEVTINVEDVSYEYVEQTKMVGITFTGEAILGGQALLDWNFC